MPFKNQVHVDKLLTNVSMKYQNQEHIHDKIFPKLEVSKSTDRIRVYVRNQRLQETSRADKAKARESSFEMSYSSYSLEKHALKDYLGVDERQDNDIGDLRADVVEDLSDKISVRKEYDFAQLFATTTSWSNNVSLAAAYSSNTTTTNPIPDFDSAASTILKSSGMLANKGIIPLDPFLSIKNHTSIIERLKYTTAEVDKVKIAALLGVSELHVPAAQYDSSHEGLTESLGNMYADNCWLGHSAKRPGMRQVSAGYMLQRKGLGGQKVSRWIDPERNDAEAIEVQCDFQFKIIASLGGYLIKGA